jgi:hypothetical protein
MKKEIVKATFVATMLFSVVLGQGGITNAAAATPVATAKPTATVKPAATPTPIMRDNLSKYGLKKDMELPVTVTAGGLSYTLEKIMIYDINSDTVKGLKKKYEYGNVSGLVANPKYFIWTKITIKNNSKNTVDNISGEKWSLSLMEGGQLDPLWNFSRMGKTNDKEALNRLILKPGEKLTSYQAFMYAKDIKSFVIRLFFNGQFDEKYVVKVS